MSGKKERDAAAAEKERTLKEADIAALEKKESEAETKDMLGDQDNEDVIF